MDRIEQLEKKQKQIEASIEIIISNEIIFLRLIFVISLLNDYCGFPKG